ncbi:MAG: hypothetical protein ACJAVA_000310 [Flavobacteriaceae bacterium]|jgi:hypothetical protein
MKSIKLKSVGAIAKGKYIYAMLSNGKRDKLSKTKISECIENSEWFISLSLEDRTKLYHYTNTVNPKEDDFFVNEFTTINNFDFQDEQIYEFMKWGKMHPYRKFKGSIEGKKVEGFVCLSDDAIYNLSYIK